MSTDFFNYLHKRGTISRFTLDSMEHERRAIIDEALRTCDTAQLAKTIDSHEFYNNLSFLPSVWTNPSMHDYMRRKLIRRIADAFCDEKVRGADYWTFVYLTRTQAGNYDTLTEINEIVFLPGFEDLIIQNQFSSGYGKRTAYKEALSRFQKSKIDLRFFLFEIAAPALEIDLLSRKEAKSLLSAIPSITVYDRAAGFDDRQEAAERLKSIQIRIDLKDSETCRFPKMAELVYDHFKKVDEHILPMVTPGASPELLQRIWEEYRITQVGNGQVSKAKFGKNLLKLENCSHDTALDIYRFLLTAKTGRYDYFTHSLLDEEFMRTAKIYVEMRGLSKKELRMIEKNTKAANRII